MGQKMLSLFRNFLFHSLWKIHDFTHSLCIHYWHCPSWDYVYGLFIMYTLLTLSFLGLCLRIIHYVYITDIVLLVTMPTDYSLCIHYWHCPSWDYAYGLFIMYTLLTLSFLALCLRISPTCCFISGLFYINTTSRKSKAQYYRYVSKDASKYNQS